MFKIRAIWLNSLCFGNRRESEYKYFYNPCSTLSGTKVDLDLVEFLIYVSRHRK